MTDFILDRITIPGSDVALIETAAREGYAGITLSVHTQFPIPGFSAVSIGTPQFREIEAALRDTGLYLLGGEFAPISPAGPSDADLMALETTARLGGRTVTALFFEKLDDETAAAALATYARRAADFGIALTIEFIASTMTGSACSLPAAARLIALSGASNIGITADMLHLTRTGATPADIAAVDPALFRYIQLCDGPATMPDDRHTWEAGSGRLLPGEGEFRITEYLAELPAGLPIGMECPNEASEPRTLAARALAAGRRAMEAVTAPVGR